MSWFRGSEPERLTTDGKLKSAPVFVSRQEVVFSVHDSPNLVALKRLKVKDGTQEKVHPSVTAHQFDPAYSPDGKRIAFSSSRDGDFEIYVMDADGGNVRRLTKSPGLDTRPAWSPNGKRIAFTSNRYGNYEIYIMDADGSHQRRVTDNPGKDDYATWHPDGKRLLIVSERGGKYDLYLIDVPD